MKRIGNSQNGFTLSELLVVVSVITLITAATLSTINGAVRRAQENRIRAQLQQVKAAILTMEHDTGRWPGGCRPRTWANPEMNLETDQHLSSLTLVGGLRNLPVEGGYSGNTSPIAGGDCLWSLAERNLWRGPYLDPSTSLIDPWGNPLLFDADFAGITGSSGGPGCTSLGCCTTDDFDGIALVSWGIDGLGYTCDDIEIPMCIVHDIGNLAECW